MEKFFFKLVVIFSFTKIQLYNGNPETDKSFPNGTRKHPWLDLTWWILGRPTRGKNPAVKAAYLLPKKGSLPLLPKKGSLPLLPKMAAYRKKKKQEEEAEKEDEKKTKEEEQQQQQQQKYIIKKKQIITNSVDPHELLSGVSHLANPGMCNTTTTTCGSIGPRWGCLNAGRGQLNAGGQLRAGGGRALWRCRMEPVFKNMNGVQMHYIRWQGIPFQYSPGKKGKFIWILMGSKSSVFIIMGGSCSWVCFP